MINPFRPSPAFHTASDQSWVWRPGNEAKHTHSEATIGSILQVDRAPHRKVALQTFHMFVAAGAVQKASELIELYQEIGYKLFP